jgi:uncharacterized phiE125 gp8 family phage protein
MITLDTIKTALKIETTFDDQDLLRLRDAVIALVETHTGLSLCPRTVQLYIKDWTRIRLPETPFVSVTSVTYTSTGGTATTMPSTDYFVQRAEAPSIYLAFSKEPGIKEYTEACINYQVGYGQIPADLQHAVIALIGTFYENPGSLQAVGAGPLPFGAEMILQNLKAKGSLS